MLFLFAKSIWQRDIQNGLKLTYKGIKRDVLLKVTQHTRQLLFLEEGYQGHTKIISHISPFKYVTSLPRFIIMFHSREASDISLGRVLPCSSLWETLSSLCRSPYVLFRQKKKGYYGVLLLRSAPNKSREEPFHAKSTKLEKK